MSRWSDRRNASCSSAVGGLGAFMDPSTLHAGEGPSGCRPLGSGTSSFEAGDDVHVRVFYGLTGGSAVVEPDIEAIGLEFRAKLISHLGH